MTEPVVNRSARPIQATLLAVFTIAGSVVMLLFAFQDASSIGSLETQERIADMLKEPPLKSSGIGPGELQTVLHVMAIVAGGAAVASAILGQQVLVGNRQARLVLTFLAPVHLTAGLVVGGLAGGLVAGATLVMWTEPTRSWLAGRPIPERYLPPGRGGGRPRSQADAGPSAAHPTPPPAPTTSSALSTASEPGAVGVADPPITATGPTEQRPRPPRVAFACIAAVVCSAIAALGIALYGVYVWLERDTVGADGVKQIDEMLGAENNPYTADGLVAVMLVLCGVLLLWALVTIPIALLALAGRGWARVSLIVSSSVAAPVSLLGALTILPLAFSALSVVCLVNLSRREATEWYAEQKQLRAARQVGRG